MLTQERVGITKLKDHKLEIKMKFLVIRWEGASGQLLRDYLSKFLLVGHFLTIYTMRYHSTMRMVFFCHVVPSLIP